MQFEESAENRLVRDERESVVIRESAETGGK